MRDMIQAQERLHGLLMHDNNTNNVKKQMEKGMLILTRRPGESIIIGENIKICILEVNGTQVKIGTNAPKHVTVHREEIKKKIDMENSLNQESFNV